MQLINGLGGAVGFGENYIARNDDSYASNINITSVFGPGGLNFYGQNYTTISINNNGNITFGGTGLSSYTPWGMQVANNKPMIAAFFADVDTRGYTTNVNGPGAVTPTAGGTSQGSNLVWYDFDPSGYGILTVTWDDVGYFSSQTNKLNAFQMRLIGTGGGNFAIEFRYEDMNWTTGSASGGTSGLGGTVARAGFTAGDGTSYYELTQSGVQDQMLNLEVTPGNTGYSGYYLFNSTSGSAGNDVIYGNESNNLISGGAGNDTLFGMGGDDQLDGGIGSDTMRGGQGNDLYFVDLLTDVVIEAADEGIDTVQTAITYSLAAVPNVENIRLTGSSNINATGNDLNNTLISNSGNNILNGGNGTDTASFELSSASVTASLMTNTATGNGSDTLVSIENFTGSIYADTLTGNNNNNVLNGLNGIDTMTGLGGDDIYYVDNTSDVVIEATGAGFDTVRSTATYTLSANVENLVLTGSDAINGTGNLLDNYIAGNNAANILNGGAGNDRLTGGAGDDRLIGGAGSDNMDGGTGNDTYVVDSLGDVVTEFYSEGIDTVESSITYTLGLNLENLTLTGSAAINGTGNALDNTIYGNSGNNTLTGGAGNDFLNGGLGNDTMLGGTGNDTYVVDSAGDIITELFSAGTDTVQSSITYTLGSNLENLTLTGSAAINGTGNTQNNVIIGNSGNNILNGDLGNDTLYGGLGNDTLTGGAGSDYFVFNTAPNAATNKDTVTDFATGVDKLLFSKAVFTGLGSIVTGLSAAQFWSGAGVAAAHDATDRIIYNTTTGALYYDADGAGGVAAVQVALLGTVTHPALAFTDITIAA